MPSLNQRVDAVFAEWNNKDSPGCVLAVIKDGKMIHQRGYGMADLERGIRITPDSVFDIGSTGKQFTATVIAILADQGHLSLDDSIRKYVPEMPAYAADITIRHLIHHTGGLRDYLTLMEICGMDDVNFYPEDPLFDLIVRQKAGNFKPGREFLYSNTGYFLLGKIAQRVTGKHITELIKEHILDPLGMSHTTFNKNHRPIVKHRALSYDVGEDGTFINAIALSGGYGDGAILTNIHDLLLWDRNFYDNKLNDAQPGLIKQLHQTGILSNGRSINYAFGLTVDTHRGQKIVMHAGSWAGYRTEMMRFPDQKFTVICISNLGSIDSTTLCQQVADIYLGNRLKSNPTKKADQVTSQLEQISGVFQGKYKTVVIFNKETVLYYSHSGREHRLIPLGKKKFQLDGTLDSISFFGAHNTQLSYNEYGMQPAKFRRVGNEPFIPPSTLSCYEGEYNTAELNTRYTITITDDKLQLKRTPYDKRNPVRFLTEAILQCAFGEMQLKIKDGIAKGFTLNADKVINLKFRKIKQRGEIPA